MPLPGPIDRFFLAAERSGTPQHAAVLAVFAKPDDADAAFVPRLLEGLRQSRSVTSPMNYRLAGARRAMVPRYVVVPDAEIDLEYHVRADALPAPGGQRQLGELVSRLQSQPLDRTRPLWEVHLIDGLEGDRFALYIKVHHAVMDGAGGVLRLTSMLSDDPTDGELRPLWSVDVTKPSRRRKPGPAHVATQGVRSAVGLGVGLGVAAVAQVSDHVIPGQRDRARPFDVPRTSFNASVGQQRRVATQSFPLEEFRALAGRAGVSVNELILAVCAGALRRYLVEEGQLPAKPLVAGTPVNLREDDATATNAISLTVMSLATDVEDPLERLAAIHRSSELAKGRLAGLGTGAVQMYPVLFLGPALGAGLVGLSDRVPAPFNVAISSGPGPAEQLYFAGARLEGLYPFATLFHGVGLFVGVVSISGRVCLGFTGDRETVPHLQRIAVHAQAAYAELQAAAPA